MPYFGSDWLDPDLDRHRNVIIAQAARDWVAARQGCLGVATVTPDGVKESGTE